MSGVGFLTARQYLGNSCTVLLIWKTITYYVFSVDQEDSLLLTGCIPFKTILLCAQLTSYLYEIMEDNECWAIRSRSGGQWT